MPRKVEITALGSSIAEGNIGSLTRFHAVGICHVANNGINVSRRYGRAGVINFTMFCFCCSYK